MEFFRELVGEAQYFFMIRQVHRSSIWQKRFWSFNMIIIISVGKKEKTASEKKIADSMIDLRTFVPNVSA